MTDVYANIQNGKYENTAKWPVGYFNDPVISKLRLAYHEEQSRIDNEFYVDVCADLELDPNKEFAKELFEKAFNDGVAFGYTEVYNKMVDLIEFVGEVTALLQKGD